MSKKFGIAMAAIATLCVPATTIAQSVNGIQKTKFQASNGKKVNITKNEFTGEVEIEYIGSLSSSSWTVKASCKLDRCETPYAVINVYMDYDAPYSKATLRGGIDVPATFGRSIVNSCRSGCNYFQIIIMPITAELSDKAGNEPLQVMLTGGADDKLIDVDMRGYRAVLEAVRNVEKD